ncbi:MAG: FAD-binding oxidoreductase [Candidatus Andersenbacteria bacterium]
MLQQPIAIPRLEQGRLTAHHQLTPKIIVIQIISDKPVSYLPGQYASFLINEQRRPLSYATPPQYPYLEFVVDISPGGVASQFVQNLAPGDPVTFMSPYGRFLVEHESKRPLLFIATGSGIGPIRAQILAELARDPALPMTLLFGNQDEHYFFFDDEFTELAHIHPHFTFIPVCSEPSDVWAGERGLVTAVTPRRVKNLSEHAAYICGTPAMVKDTLAMLREHGLPEAHLHTEQFT